MIRAAEARNIIPSEVAREAVLNAGFTPLCNIENAEHFVRGPRRCVLVYSEDHPSLEDNRHVHFVKVGDNRIIALT